MYFSAYEGVFDQGAEMQQGEAKGNHNTDMRGCSASVNHSRTLRYYPGEGTTSIYKVAVEHHKPCENEKIPLRVLWGSSRMHTAESTSC